MKAILPILLLFTGCSYKTVPFNAAPKSYIVEKIEPVKLDKSNSFYYCKSVVTGNYGLTVEWPNDVAEVGDTVKVIKYHEGLLISEKSE